MSEKKLGRPNKLKSFCEAFEILLQDSESDVIYLTDDELRICCNDLLDEDSQISDTTFENWKAGKLQDSPEYRNFLVLYKRALINQKKDLFKSLRYDENQWQKIAWIIERKFSDWNLKLYSEVKEIKKVNLDSKDIESKSLSDIQDYINNKLN